MQFIELFSLHRFRYVQLFLRTYTNEATIEQMSLTDLSWHQPAWYTKNRDRLMVGMTASIFKKPDKESEPSV
jgi:hypothetical protein